VHTAPPKGVEAENFDALYRGHVRDVYRYSLSLVRDPAEAEDVTQATFLNALQAYGTNPPRKPRQWLMAIARNICLDRHRQAQRRPQQVTLHEVPAGADEELRVRADQIVSALQGLPTRQRMALLLDGLEGKSRAQIAAELGVGEPAVAKLLVRGRSNLRLQLEEGMTCKHARAAAPGAWDNEAFADAKQRAAIAHLRNCGRCSSAVKPRSLAGFVASAWPLLRNLGATGSAKVAALGGGSVALKVATLATVGTIAGGIALHETTAHRAPQPATPPVGAADVTGAEMRPAERRAEANGRRVVVTPAITANAPVPHGHRPVDASGVFVPTAKRTDAGPTRPSAAQPAQVKNEPRATTPAPAAPVVEEPHGGHTTAPGSTAPAPSTEEPSAVHETPATPTAPPSPVTHDDDPAPGNSATARTNAPGQQANPGQGASASAQGQAASASAQADDDKPGQANGGGQATAPGQLNNPGQGNGNPGGGQATAPGQQDNPGQGNGNAGGGQATAPGQQDNPGQGNGNPGGGQATAPGQADNPGQANGNGQASAPGQQAEHGNANGNTGNGQANAAGRQEKTS
jgi:RNA polymerase sigma factor (sigma-70 family)